MAEHKVKHEEQLTRGEAARMLSEIARQLSAGPELVLALGDQEASCTVADRLEIEVEVKAARDGGGKIEIELKWAGVEQETAAPTP